MACHRSIRLLSTGNTRLIMAKDDGKGLPKPAGNGPFLISKETYQKLVGLAESGAVQPDPNQFEVLKRNGTTYFKLRGGPGGQDGSRDGTRFPFWIGGAANDRLYVGSGSVRYIEVRKTETDETRFIRPVFPTFNGVSVDHQDAEGAPPYVALGSKTNGSLWLIVQDSASKCSTSLPAETGDAPERIELTNRGSEPELNGGELAILIANMDFAAAATGKALANVVVWIASDVEVPYSCNDSSSGSDDSGNSDDGGNSDDSDGSDDSGDSDDSGGGGEPGACCPSRFVVLRPTVNGIGSTTGARCYPSAGVLTETYVTVSGNVAWGPGQTECQADCRGRLIVHFTVTGAVNDVENGYLRNQYQILGFAGAGPFGAVFKCLLASCTPIVAKAWISSTLAVGTDHCVLGDCMVTSAINLTPPRCGDTDCGTSLPEETSLPDDTPEGFVPLVTLTAEEYDALDPKDPDTLYDIEDA